MKTCSSTVFNVQNRKQTPGHVERSSKAVKGSPATCQQPALRMQLVASAAPACVPVEYSSPGDFESYCLIIPFSKDETGHRSFILQRKHPNEPGMASEG